MLFFFKQKTAYESRISDWSSDVCSSDLGVALAGEARGEQRIVRHVPGREGQQHDAGQSHQVREHCVDAGPCIRLHWHPLVTRWTAPRTATLSNVPRTATLSNVPRTATLSNVPRTATLSNVPRTATLSNVPRTATLSNATQTAPSLRRCRSWCRRGSPPPARSEHRC